MPCSSRIGREQHRRRFANVDALAVREDDVSLFEDRRAGREPRKRIVVVDERVAHRTDHEVEAIAHWSASSRLDALGTSGTSADGFRSRS
jgi:hypothetical protein